MQTVLEIPKSQKNNILCELASRNLWWFCKLLAPDFYIEKADYLKEMCDAIQDFENDDNELLVIAQPPRHGKSRTKDLASQWLLGRNNRYKIMSASYNETLSQRSSKEVRDSINALKASSDTIVFSDIFPNTKVARGSARIDLWKLVGNKEYNYLSTSPSATSTGFGADFLLIDDVIKDSYEAGNARILDNHFMWFTNTIYSRLEGKRKVMIIMTRWATKDLAGRVVEMYLSQGRKVKLLTKQAFDGEKMLNDDVLNKKQYDFLVQTIGEEIVEANYNQHPIDLKGTLYSEFKTYTELPPFLKIEARCDTADKGDDYLCLIIYGITVDTKAYVLDVYYTQNGIDVTEKEIPKRLTKHNVKKAMFESNFGGTAFAKLIRKNTKALGNKHTFVGTFTQTLNKEARILSNCTNVTNNIIMPEDWGKRWFEFYRDVTEYQRVGKNKHDDAPDTLTMVAESLKPTRNIRDAFR